MALLLAPYNNSLRLGQGFNSYTHQICSDNAVTADVPSTPSTGSDAAVDTLPTTRTIYPSQIVSYSSRFVEKLSDVTDSMNISGSLTIKYGAIGGSGSGSYVDTDKFKESDLNFLVTVKVVNQQINATDNLKFNSIKGLTRDDKFMQAFGDCFISGFLEGGEFNALISMKILNKNKSTEIAAAAKVALTVGPGSIDAEANVEMAKANLDNNTETTINVNWSGGGSLKDESEAWTIESIIKVAAKFPDLVAKTPQRTYAILTKYTALRSYLMQTDTPSPLDYENAGTYTNYLMDMYMDCEDPHQSPTWLSHTP
jgi:hypothetical protein